MVEEAKKLLDNSKLVLPSDIVVSKSIKEPENIETVNYDNIKQGYYGLDIGPKSILRYERILRNAHLVLWNGPMGLFEIPPFDKATNEIAKSLSTLNAKVIVGGGDSVAAIDKIGISNKFYHISTGGGASLEFLEGKDLPGIIAIEY